MIREVLDFHSQCEGRCWKTNVNVKCAGSYFLIRRPFYTKKTLPKTAVTMITYFIERLKCPWFSQSVWHQIDMTKNSRQKYQRRKKHNTRCQMWQMAYYFYYKAPPFNFMNYLKIRQKRKGKYNRRKSGKKSALWSRGGRGEEEGGRGRGGEGRGNLGHQGPEL